MTIRNIPYGYKIDNGVCIIVESEKKIICEIVRDYLNGKALKTIAEELTYRRVEYNKGVTDWNKARIKHILDDRRYVGDSKYPQIIDKETYERLQSLKESKNTQKGVDRKKGIFQLQLPVYCPICGGVMHRRAENQYTHKERWVCTNSDCKKMIVKTDKDLLADLTSVTNYLIENPQIMRTELSTEDTDNGLEYQNEEVERLMSSCGIEEERVKNAIYGYAEKYYVCLEGDDSTTDMLIDLYGNATPSEELLASLLNRSLDGIRLYENGRIGILLINRQEITSGGTYATR